MKVFFIFFWLIHFNPKVHSVLHGLVYENCSRKGVFKSDGRGFFKIYLMLVACHSSTCLLVFKQYELFRLRICRMSLF